jgi:MFS family permease
MSAAGPMNALADNGGYPWRMIFLFLGGLGVVLSILIVCFVENNRQTEQNFQILARPGPMKQTLQSLIKQPQVWFIGLYSASVYFGIEYLSENSGKAFLMLNGYSSQSASNFITLAWLGYAIGCPALGLLSDWLCRRKSVLTLASLIGMVAMYLILYMPHHPSLLLIGFFTLGLGASGQSVAFATIAEQCEPKYLALGLGFNNACIIMLASINAPIIAWILNQMSPIQSQLTIGNYQTALTLLIAFLGISIICASLFIKETYCKSTKAATKLQY